MTFGSPPVVDQLVASSADQPSDGDLVAGVVSGDGCEERVGSEIFGGGGMVAPAHEVAVDVRQGLVVQLQQRAHGRYVVRQPHIPSRSSQICSSC